LTGEKADDIAVEAEIEGGLTAEAALLVIVAEAAGVTVHAKEDFMIEATETEEEIAVIAVADHGAIAEAGVDGIGEVKILVEIQREIEKEEGEVVGVGAQVVEVIGDPLAIVPAGA